MNNIERRIQSILEQLEETNEDLLALSDDIWLSIDHNDNEALEEGIQFKTEYNERLTEFNKLSKEIESLVRNYTGLTNNEEIAEISTSENERIIKALDKKKKHNLNEDFKYKRPYGFTIKGKAYQNVRSWRKMYQYVIQYLDIHYDNFDELAGTDEFISNRGNKDFSYNSEDLRHAINVNNRIYAEGNLSANQIRDRIVKLLAYFGISNNEFDIYLREDRDWNK